MDKAPKTRRTLGVSRKLPKPSRLTFKDPGKSKNKPLSVKRTGVKKGIAGTAGGAALGGILGGPLGAVAGGGLGHVAEEAIGKGTDKKMKKMRKGLAGTAGGAALGGMVGGPLGAIAGGGIGHIAEGAIGKGTDKKKTPASMKKSREQRYISLMLSKAISSMLPEIIKEIKKDGFNVPVGIKKIWPVVGAIGRAALSGSKVAGAAATGAAAQRVGENVGQKIGDKVSGNSQQTQKSLKKGRLSGQADDVPVDKYGQEYFGDDVSDIENVSTKWSSSDPILRNPLEVTEPGYSSDRDKRDKKFNLQDPKNPQFQTRSMIQRHKKRGERLYEKPPKGVEGKSVDSKKSLKKSSTKGKPNIYLSPNTPVFSEYSSLEKPPKGSKIKTGPKGGQWVEGKSIDSKKKLKREIDVKKIGPLAAGLLGAGAMSMLKEDSKKVKKVKIARAKKEIEKKIPNKNKIKKGAKGALAGGAIGGAALGPLGAAGGAYLGHLLENKLKQKPSTSVPRGKRTEVTPQAEVEPRKRGVMSRIGDKIGDKTVEWAGKKIDSIGGKQKPSTSIPQTNVPEKDVKAPVEASKKDYPALHQMDFRGPYGKPVTKMVKSKKTLRKQQQRNVKKMQKGYLGDNNSELSSATSKVTRDNDRFTEDTVTTLSRKDANMERSELDMAKSHLQASMKVEKAIFYLQGYEPMNDAQVKKSFHGQIPDLMKEVENRPPQDWWVKTINKSSTFDNDPIQYTADLWYGDLNKAVAEHIDSDYAPKKKGEENQISDGSRADVSDLAGEEKSEITETL